MDGIPLLNSSNKEFWPILGYFHLNNVKLNPFVAVIFFGEFKLFSVQDYLKEFIYELNNLTVNGFKHNEGFLPEKCSVFQWIHLLVLQAIMGILAVNVAYKDGNIKIEEWFITKFHLTQEYMIFLKIKYTQNITSHQIRVIFVKN